MPVTSNISPGLQRFVSEFPLVRASILSDVRALAASLGPGSRVIDVGAGEAPYQELFDHCAYTTVDWENSVHPNARRSSLIASADAIPLPDNCADAVVLTEVLEHIVEPLQVLRELYRLLRPGGAALVTTPFVWELHEMPFDCWRFTPVSLQWLMEQAGFVDVVVEARNDCFSTAAQVLINLTHVMGMPDDDSRTQRLAVIEACKAFAAELAKFAPLDVEWILPLGFTARARRPSDDATAGQVRVTSVRDHPAMPISDDSRASIAGLRKRADALREMAVASGFWTPPQRIVELEGRVADLEGQVEAVEARLQRVLRHPATRAAKALLRIPGARRLAGLRKG
jgi:SAM-dependent methyltransferase